MMAASNHSELNTNLLLEYRVDTNYLWVEALEVSHFFSALIVVFVIVIVLV